MPQCAALISRSQSKRNTTSVRRHGDADVSRHLLRIHVGRYTLGRRLVGEVMAHAEDVVVDLAEFSRPSPLSHRRARQRPQRRGHGGRRAQAAARGEQRQRGEGERDEVVEATECSDGDPRNANAHRARQAHHPSRRRDTRAEIVFDHRDWKSRRTSPFSKKGRRNKSASLSLHSNGCNGVSLPFRRCGHAVVGRSERRDDECSRAKHSPLRCRTTPTTAHRHRSSRSSRCGGGGGRSVGRRCARSLCYDGG